MLIPAPLEPGEELTKLVMLLKLGDASARTAIILGHMSLAQKLAFSLAKRQRCAANELIAEAMYILTIVVERAKTYLIDDNITAYINTSIRRDLLLYWKKNRTINVTHTVRPEEKLDHREDNDRNFKETLDALVSVLYTETEREIFTLRMMGYTMAEISEQLGIPPVKISTMIARIQEKFKGALDANT